MLSFPTIRRLEQNNNIRPHAQNTGDCTPTKKQKSIKTGISVIDLRETLSSYRGMTVQLYLAPAIKPAGMNFLDPQNLFPMTPVSAPDVAARHQENVNPRDTLLFSLGNSLPCVSPCKRIHSKHRTVLVYRPSDTQILLGSLEIWQAPKPARPPKRRPAAREGTLPGRNDTQQHKNEQHTVLRVMGVTFQFKSA